MKKRSKCCRAICISLESIKPFSSYKALKSGQEPSNGSLLTSEIFGNIRLISPKMTSHLTSHNFQILKIEIFSKPCKMFLARYRIFPPISLDGPTCGRAYPRGGGGCLYVGQR